MEKSSPYKCKADLLWKSKGGLLHCTSFDFTCRPWNFLCFWIAAIIKRNKNILSSPAISYHNDQYYVGLTHILHTLLLH